MNLRILAPILFVLALAVAQPAHAAYMSPISDLIAQSEPSTSTPHIITFRVHNAVPVSGTITITPEGAFSIPGGFDFTDVDFAVSTGGPYAERELAASADAVNDGISVVTGVAGSITITLNATDNIPANAMVRVVLGTAASHQSVGGVSPVNPATTGSYRIKVQTGNGGTNIDEAKAMIVVLQPVTNSLTVPYLAPVIFNAYPSGVLPAGSSVIELSLETDKPSTCRYATSSGITYGSMTHTFTAVNGMLFYADIPGHQDNTSYTYYVRCSDTNNLVNLDDFLISFSLGPVPDVTASDGSTPNGGTTAASGSGGSGGVGSIAGGSSLLFLASVTLSGKAPAGSSVTILKDGKSELTVQASSEGGFSAKIPGLERGAYTFVAFATDAKGNKTSRFSSTLTVVGGTNNEISNVVLSPTVAPDAPRVDPGSSIHISGAGVPNTTVGILVHDVPTSGEASITKEYQASSTANWDFTIPAKDLKRGTFSIQVKTIMSDVSSGLSAPLYVGVGEDPSKKADTGNRSDINKDGRVNLVDFSILLTHWNESDADADINEDGTVNLADFSILLFNWTG